MSGQGVQQALSTGTWSPDAIHSTVGYAAEHAEALPDSVLVALRCGTVST